MNRQKLGRVMIGCVLMAGMYGCVSSAPTASLRMERRYQAVELGHSEEEVIELLAEPDQVFGSGFLFYRYEGAEAELVMRFQQVGVGSGSMKVDTINGWYKLADGTQVIVDMGSVVGSRVPEQNSTLRKKLQRLKLGMNLEQAREVLGHLQEQNVGEYVADLGRYDVLTVSFIDGKMTRATGSLSLDTSTKLAVDLQRVEK